MSDSLNNRVIAAAEAIRILAAQVSADKATCQGILTQIRDYNIPSLVTTKEAIRQALIGKGVAVASTVALSDYPQLIAGIQSGSNYYKCASIDTVNNTWTGYKAIKVGNSFGYEATVTTGLTYGSGYTPEINKIYDAEALVMIGKLYSGLQEGLTFYAPLAEQVATAETGQTLNYPSGGFSFITKDNIPCVQFNGTQGISVGSELVARDGTPFSVSCWFQRNADVSDGQNFMAVVMGGYPEAMWAGSDNQYAWFANTDGSGTVRVPITVNVWCHIVITVGNGTIRIYKNGTFVTSTNMWSIASSDSRPPIIGCPYGTLHGCIAALRVFNRVISDSEIATLASEFTIPA